MAVYYVDDGGNDSNGSDWTNAFNAITNATVLAAPAGSTIYVGSDSVDTAAVTRTLNFSGSTAAAPITIISADITSGTPPTNYVTQEVGGGYIQGTGGSSDITFPTGVYVTVYGINFIADDKTYMNGSGLELYDCNIESYDTLWIGYPESYAKFTGCTFDLSSHISINPDSGKCIFRDSVLESISSSGHFNPSDSVKGLLVEDCDLSSEATVFVGFYPIDGEYIFRRCRMATSWEVHSSLAIVSRGVTILFDSCDDGTQANPIVGMQRYYAYEGSVVHEGTTYRTTGADDGTTPHSWKMVTLASKAIEYTCPLRSPPITAWVAGGSEITVTVHVTHASMGSGTSSDLETDEFWIELSGPDDGDYAQGYFATSLPATILTTPGDIPDATGEWTSAKAVEQKVSITYTPQDAGPVIVRCCLGLASATVYVDPKIEVT